MSTRANTMLERSAGGADGVAVSTIDARSKRAASELPRLLGDRALYVRLVHDHDQWYAEATDFQIVGLGQTRTEATATMLRMLRSYLRARERGGVGQERRARRRWPAVWVRLLAL